jgi:hypothetical protein
MYQWGWGVVIVVFYILYLRFRFERYLLRFKFGYWDLEKEKVDWKSKVKCFLFPFALYALSIALLIYHYSELSKLAILWVHFDLNGNPDISTTANTFLAFDVMFGALILSSMLLSFSRGEVISFSKACALTFIVWLILESDIIYYNLAKTHFIAHLACLKGNKGSSMKLR